MMQQYWLKKLHFFKEKHAGWAWAGLAAASMVSYFLLAYGTLRTQFGQLLGLFGLLFLAYGGLLYLTNVQPKLAKAGMGLAVLTRLLLLAAVPNLSDDYARFVWDGRLLAAGFNPYLYLPSALPQTTIFAEAGLSDALFQQLNSPQYFTVYPPLNQFIFGAAAWLSSGNLWYNLVFLRGFIVLAELGTLWLLATHTPLKTALLYGLNPLVIIELTGNLHFEGIVIFFLTLALVWARRRWGWSAGALGLAVGTKLLPLLFLPLLVVQLGWRRGGVYAVVVGAVVGLLFAPFLSFALLQNMGSSLDLYFQKFEFNASFYYLLGAVGRWIKGYNVIQTLGPGLSLVGAAGVVWIAFSKAHFWCIGGNVLFNKALWSLLVYFLGATTVHPWYITTLVAMGCFTHWRFAVVWSAGLPLSYAAYSRVPFQESVGLLWLEYGLLLGYVCFEIRRQNKAASKHIPDATATP